VNVLKVVAWAIVVVLMFVGPEPLPTALMVAGLILEPARTLPWLRSTRTTSSR
jgi:hypothetical protein